MADERSSWRAAIIDVLRELGFAMSSISSVSSSSSRASSASPASSHPSYGGFSSGSSGNCCSNNQSTTICPHPAGRPQDYTCQPGEQKNYWTCCAANRLLVCGECNPPGAISCINQPRSCSIWWAVGLPCGIPSGSPSASIPSSGWVTSSYASDMNKPNCCHLAKPNTPCTFPAGHPENYVCPPGFVATYWTCCKAGKMYGCGECHTLNPARPNCFSAGPGGTFICSIWWGINQPCDFPSSSGASKPSTPSSSSASRPSSSGPSVGSPSPSLSGT